jgi:hypothetical protein
MRAGERRERVEHIHNHSETHSIGQIVSGDGIYYNEMAILIEAYTWKCQFSLPVILTLNVN